MNLTQPRAPSVDGAEPVGEQSSRYQCPMHPSVVQDHPGDCPICGMRLVKAELPAATAPDAGERIVRFYRSPMNPRETSPTPRQDEMGMDYLPVYEDEVHAAAPVPGLAAVDIEPARQQLIGLTTAEVTEGPVGGAWRTVGRVTIDETRVRHINLKVSGFVERVNVDFVGKKVNRGDPLFSIYSPELFLAQEEYLLALRTKAALARAGTTESGDGDDLVRAARRKLALWDVPESELEAVERNGQPTKAITFYSPVTGVVTRKDVVEGMKLDAGAMPYEIVDLSTVWVLADVYESELRLVEVGMGGKLVLNAFPNRVFEGKVVFIDPVLDPQTRTVKVRLTFPNPTGELRPEMFGEVVLLGAPHQALRVTPDAVIDSGTKKIVFVAIGAGRFQPKEVVLGASDGTFIEVVSGLAAGERVVARANFLVDSESRLKASLSEVAGTPTEPKSARALPVENPGRSPSPTEPTPSAPNPEHSGHRP
ncbi:MAG: efflux RND transporter periplasmic adaptor subunit [Deltaproteobacteria bacterium]|nr:efflux RND transporter periplasmic adaptor subunit [Deltaproteobacteria bacterium]